MLTIDPVPLTDDAIDDVKTYLRIDTPDDDALIASLIASALTRAEEFCGQLLIIRNVIEQIATGSTPARPSQLWQGRGACDWQVLSMLPVTSIGQINSLALDGTTTPLIPAQFSIDIMADGSGWVQVVDAAIVGRAEVMYTAGQAANWDALPEGLRFGVIRLAAYLYTSRDAAVDAGPPTAVAALLRPYRRMRLK